jgi:hypothetical protein
MTSEFTGLMINSTDLAKLIGLTDRQVRNHARSGLFPTTGKGQKKFDARICIPAYIKYLQQGREADGALSAEKLKLTAARRHDIEQRTASRDRKLIPLDEAVSVLFSVVNIYSSQLDGLGGRNCNALAAESDPAIVKDLLFHETRRIRNAAADQIQSLAVPTAGVRDGTSTRGADGG